MHFELITCLCLLFSWRNDHVHSPIFQLEGDDFEERRLQNQLSHFSDFGG